MNIINIPKGEYIICDPINLKIDKFYDDVVLLYKSDNFKNEMDFIGDKIPIFNVEEDCVYKTEVLNYESNSLYIESGFIVCIPKMYVSNNDLIELNENYILLNYDTDIACFEMDNIINFGPIKIYNTVI